MSDLNNKNFIVIASWMVTDLELKGNELLVYACIYGFSQNGNGFNGSINYLKSWIGSSKNTVLNILKSLENKGLIEKSEVYRNNIKFCEYYARLDQINANCTGGAKIAPNNINIHISNNTYKDDIDNIIKYLNILLGSKFALGTQKTRNLIFKWLKLGYTVDDFKAVIDSKTKEWKNTEFAQYLRPETLFGNKFEGYLNYANMNNRKEQSNGTADRGNDTDRFKKLFEQAKAKGASDEQARAIAESML